MLVRALVAYSIYEHGYEGGTATAIRLTLHPRGCTLEDNGRGMGLHREGYVKDLVEQLGVRSEAVALHGLGLALIAMSSPSLEIESRREGRKYNQHFSWAMAQGAVRVEPWEGPSGTRITVTLQDSAPDIDLEEVAEQVQVWRAAHPELRIEIVQGGTHAF